jgi:hypothetical protein
VKSACESAWKTAVTSAWRWVDSTVSPLAGPKAALKVARMAAVMAAKSVTLTVDWLAVAKADRWVAATVVRLVAGWGTLLVAQMAGNWVLHSAAGKALQ